MPFNINRYPLTTDRSLRPWSAADELILSHFHENKTLKEGLIILNDKFGYLTVHTAEHKPTLVVERKSQEKSVLKNLKRNHTKAGNLWTINPEEKIDDLYGTALIKIPKSLDLFRLYLQMLSRSQSEKSRVIAGFMTKHFTPKLVEIANEYFTTVTQSLAKKKARVLLLSDPKSYQERELTHTLNYDGSELKQYFGVFSAQKIDIATQFLIEEMEIKESDENILDLGCGNGVIAHAARKQNPDATIQLIDDSELAIASAKLNINDNEKTIFHTAYNTEELVQESFDLVACNPPFHFGHENTLDIALNLFAGAAKALKPAGRFVCVANKHLNYKTHLEKLYVKVEVIAENDRFIVYTCQNVV